ncbi:CHAD domain-containing protein [Microcoleus sp. FACHB-1515]|uniref:CHAD domain-containing protein n=1 Tax=Cyanophyceae TaxID=3028117 RepID=UPI001683435C|nr:CHAD domain-containing protein [Microcoleus sp. FACHB-1515]MBD2089824.1 CHAD domain-containing protein [Microcoleus sp. FACHB-1515]
MAIERLGDYAYQAVQKHFKKSTKPEAEVLADTDPEALHQMRVGMRRLRTALMVFESAIDLPKTVSETRIKKFAQVLGAVRDIDVMQAKLTERYRPDLDRKEQKQLDKLLDNMKKQRKQAFADVEDLLEGKRYADFKQGFQDWLDAPEFFAIAALPIQSAVPDLLLPLISNLLLHPGWLVGAELENHSVDEKAIATQLQEQSESLHDLRKQIKRVRYQTEFFTQFYGDEFASQVEDFQNIQEVLGQIQDYSILKDFMADAMHTNWHKDLPILAQRLGHEQISLWKTWQPIQQRYLDAEFRSRLRAIVSTLRWQEAPQAESASVS